jgi:translation initiation factor 2 subunit gamma (aeIF-2g)
MVSENPTQPEVNIGLVGHVDHGKTTLVQALSGSWTDKHSEEMKRGISIRLGYADTTLRRCPDEEAPECYTVKETCDEHDVDTEPVRTVSFVDAPGHETLMATMLSGAAIMDGAVLVVSATEDVPQAQTEEHLMALDIIGIENVVIAQNKVDLVDKERAMDNYEQIQEFVKGTVAEDALVVPISAQQEVNIDLLIDALETEIPTPDRDPDDDSRMFVARSFDINRPGTTADSLLGGVSVAPSCRGDSPRTRNSKSAPAARSRRVARASGSRWRRPFAPSKPVATPWRMPPRVGCSVSGRGSTPHTPKVTRSLAR